MSNTEPLLDKAGSIYEGGSENASVGGEAKSVRSSFINQSTNYQNSVHSINDAKTERADNFLDMMIEENPDLLTNSNNRKSGASQGSNIPLDSSNQSN